MRLQGKILNLLGFVIIDLRRTNVLSATASLWIQKRILVCEIVKAALWNYLENRQGLITEDTNRQFPAGHKFFYQQFAIVVGGFGHGRFELAFISNNEHADRGTFTRRF